MGSIRRRNAWKVSSRNNKVIGGAFYVVGFFLAKEDGSWKGRRGSKYKFCIMKYCSISLVLSFNFSGEEKGGI